jgi:hypothetical protein
MADDLADNLNALRRFRSLRDSVPGDVVIRAEIRSQGWCVSIVNSRGTVLEYAYEPTFLAAVDKVQGQLGASASALPAAEADPPPIKFREFL